MNPIYETAPAEIVNRMVEVLNETYLYYTEDPSRRAVNDGGACYYRTKDGRKCAVGRCMKRPTVTMSGNADGLFRDRDEVHEIQLDDRLKPMYQGLPLRFWVILQHWHDDPTNWIRLSEGDQSAVYNDYLDLYKMVVEGEFYTEVVA